MKTHHHPHTVFRMDPAQLQALSGDRLHDVTEASA